MSDANCPNCGGHGRTSTGPCTICHGTGQLAPVERHPSPYIAAVARQIADQAVAEHEARHHSGTEIRSHPHVDEATIERQRAAGAEFGLRWAEGHAVVRSVGVDEMRKVGQHIAHDLAVAERDLADAREIVAELLAVAAEATPWIEWDDAGLINRWHAVKERAEDYLQTPTEEQQ